MATFRLFLIQTTLKIDSMYRKDGWTVNRLPRSPKTYFLFSSSKPSSFSSISFALFCLSFDIVSSYFFKLCTEKLLVNWEMRRQKLVSSLCFVNYIYVKIYFVQEWNFLSWGNSEAQMSLSGKTKTNTQIIWKEGIVSV